MSEATPPRPEIKFDDRHVDAIMDGEKTVTIRYEFEHEFEQGDVINLLNQNGHKLTTAKAVTQFELRADWVSFADFEGHRRYTTTGELLDELAEYYPGEPIGPETVLDVIVFETDLIIADGGQEPRQDDRERVTFAESYDDMPEKLDVLVGDSGFIVPASNAISFKERVLVQFDENKTGRPGGERHWIPDRCLEREPEREGVDLDAT
ncbi:ASCH domain-containing protein [Natrialba phage PhiCh1]|uniref:Virus protein phiCh1-VP75 n=2 Tax=root TaxID=1 RepID=D3T2C6_NATMM|nr:ASCH domain-containing protein [Natrialba magadii]NP_665993.1 ASCH domain-containing protein [Natrialba phage PhiCh1]YP_010078101.1 ASCH domain-containing protein [Natrialba phage PhiCh1]AAM88749.1 unknown [Natrialba phage PhiCh1]ADD07735.1 virus protein phiCh1-VP75 [Natrialba magadii ATCC 43099]ELY22982.1 hypothetical protein C500_21000 [Natrialba magadii ATCC 43099]QBJ01252.1 uncharacterized protein PhiCh1_350 [Natrialba phage PhiCh1]